MYSTRWTDEELDTGFLFFRKLITMIKLLQTSVILCLSGFLEAQNFEYEVNLKSVTFSGDDMYTIRQDDNTGYIDDFVHWEDDGTINPSAFTSGSNLKAQASIQFVCANMPDEIFVRGTGPEGIDFPAVSAAIAGDIISYPATNADQSFEDDKVNILKIFPSCGNGQLIILIFTAPEQA